MVFKNLKFHCALDENSLHIGRVNMADQVMIILFIVVLVLAPLCVARNPFFALINVLSSVSFLGIWTSVEFLGSLAYWYCHPPLANTIGYRLLLWESTIPLFKQRKINGLAEYLINKHLLNMDKHPKGVLIQCTNSIVNTSHLYKYLVRLVCCWLTIAVLP